MQGLSPIFVSQPYICFLDPLFFPNPDRPRARDPKRRRPRSVLRFSFAFGLRPRAKLNPMTQLTPFFPLAPVFCFPSPAGRYFFSNSPSRRHLFPQPSIQPLYCFPTLAAAIVFSQSFSFASNPIFIEPFYVFPQPYIFNSNWLGGFLSKIFKKYRSSQKRNFNHGSRIEVPKNETSIFEQRLKFTKT